MKHPIAILRRELNLSQREIGELVGRSQATIKAVEVGQLRLSPKLAADLSSAFGVSAEWLMRGDVTIPMPKLVGGLAERVTVPAHIQNDLVNRLKILLKKAANTQKLDEAHLNVLTAIRDISRQLSI